MPDVVVADIDTVGAPNEWPATSTVTAVDLDVTDPDASNESIGSFGDRIDILVNNAGSYHEAGSILGQSVES